VNYQVATGVLDIGDFEVDDSARAFGFMTPFGAAPPDFDARTIVHGDDIRALLGIRLGPRRHGRAVHLPWAATGSSFDVREYGPGAAALPPGGPAHRGHPHAPGAHPGRAGDRGRTLYAATRDREVRVFTDFEEYAQHVNNLLTGGSNMRALTARGSFDKDSTTLTANYVSIIFTLN
jgi:hypothetical protein